MVLSTKRTGISGLSASKRKGRQAWMPGYRILRPVWPADAASIFTILQAALQTRTGRIGHAVVTIPSTGSLRRVFPKKLFRSKETARVSAKGQREKCAGARSLPETSPQRASSFSNTVRQRYFEI
jgi:hypothetical protein